MKKREQNAFSVCREFVCWIILIYLILALPVPALSGNGKNVPKRSSIQPTKKGHLPIFLDLQEHLLPKTPTRDLDFLEDSTFINFSLDWTQCQIHSVDVSSPLELILFGSFISNSPNIWRLAAISPQPGAPPDLYFIEDVLGRTGPAYGSDIPLTWEISLDGGPFTPMTFQPDNTLTTTFPPGAHTFQVRITGELQPYQGDGYYHLQLEQCLVPEL